MFDSIPPTKQPTPAEYIVLIVFVSLVFIVLGIAAIVMGMRAPADKHEMAIALEHRGAWCLAIGIAISFVFWLTRRIIDFF
jgi:hypothetical protein